MKELCKESHYWKTVTDLVENIVFERREGRIDDNESVYCIQNIKVQRVSLRYH